MLGEVIREVVSLLDGDEQVPLALLRKLRDVTLGIMVSERHKFVEAQSCADGGTRYVVYMASIAAEDVFAVIAHHCLADVVLTSTAVEQSCQRCGAVRENPDVAAVLELPIPRMSGDSVADLLRQLHAPLPPHVGEMVCETEACRQWDHVRGETYPQPCHERTIFKQLPAVLVLSVPQAAGTHAAPRIAGRRVHLDAKISVPSVHGDQPVQYTLQCIVVPKPGHWIAYVRHDGAGQWYQCDDIDVTPVSAPEELVCSMLFYVRTDVVELGDMQISQEGRQDVEAPVSIADLFDIDAYDPPWLFEQAHEAQQRGRSVHSHPSRASHSGLPTIVVSEDVDLVIDVDDVESQNTFGTRVGGADEEDEPAVSGDDVGDVANESDISSQNDIYEQILDDLYRENEQELCSGSDDEDDACSASEDDREIHFDIEASDLDSAEERDRRDAAARVVDLASGEEADTRDEGEEHGATDMLTGSAEYEDIDEDPRRRDQRLESGLVHMLTGSVPGGILSSKQRKSKKWSELLDRVQFRTRDMGDLFWDYLPAYLAPWHYPQRAQSGHFSGCMPTKLYVANKAQEDGFVSPERMIYEKMLGLEGPEAYDPVMRSYYFSVLCSRRMESGTSATYVRRGLRGALHHKESVKELSARFGDELLPGLPVTGYDARAGVAELAALDACEDSLAAYFVTMTLAFDRLPGIKELWQRIVRHPDAQVAPHLPYLSRCWSRAQQTFFDWILLGEERAFGNVRLYARRTDYQVGQGGQNARGNLAHTHAKLWTDDKILDPDPDVRVAARTAVQARITAHLFDLILGPLEEAMRVEMRHLLNLALENQVHVHTFSCTDSEGHHRCHLPQRSRCVGEFLEIEVSIPEHVADRLEAMDGVAWRDSDTGKVKLCDWLRAGRYLPRRGTEFPMAVPIEATLYRCNCGCHICVEHCDEGHFSNSYLVHYHAGQEERLLIRPRARDKAVARLEMIDRHLRKRVMAEKRDKRKDPDSTRQSIPEPELVALLQQEPIVEVVEVVDWERGDVRPVDFIHYSTAMPSERYVRVRHMAPDAALKGDTGPVFGGPDDAEEVLSRLGHLPSRCQPSLGQLRVWLRNQRSGLCADGVAQYNMGPPALCAAGQVPFKYCNEIAVQCNDSLPYEEPLPSQRGLPRGLWEAYPGFFSLRGQRFRLRMAFFYHERYAHLVQLVFVDKMQKPQLLAAICAHWQNGTLEPPMEILDYVDWKRGRGIGVTKYVAPSQHLRWLVHVTLKSEVPFDDEAALFSGGAYIAAKGALSPDRRSNVLDGDVAEVLNRFFVTDLRRWGTGYNLMWKILMKAEAAFAEMLETAGLPCTAMERYYLPVLDRELDEEHVRRYREFEASMQGRARQAGEEVSRSREAARAVGAQQTADGFLVRAHLSVHGFAMTDAARNEHVRVYNCGADRLRIIRQTGVVPGAEDMSRDGAWVVRRYVNPLLVKGPAGVGKSHLMQALMYFSRALGLKTQFTANFAFLAVRGGGCHVHQLARFHKDDSRSTFARMAQYAMNRLRANPVLRRYLQELDVLFIGEFGNWTDRLLSALDTLLREVRRSSHPFGNLAIFADGDHYQLRPICLHGERSAMTSMLTTSLFSSLRLTQLVRCRDPALAKVHDILRKITPTTEEMRLLKDLLRLHCHPGQVPPDAVGAVRFFAHKKHVAEYNKQRAAQIPKEEKGVFQSEDWEVKHYQACELTEKSRSRAQTMLDSHTDFPRLLTVWKGLQVTYRGRNRDVETGYVKGALGPVTQFNADPERGLRWVEVQFTHPIRWSKPLRIRPVESEAIVGPEGRQITRTQIPLVSAECWTLHMGVGMTLCAVATELSMDPSDAFPWGAGHGTLRWTRASEQAGKALRSQGHQCAHVM